MKVAVSGFRHGHMASIMKSIREHPDLEIVAFAEEHPEYLLTPEISVAVYRQMFRHIAEVLEPGSNPGKR